MTVEKLEVIRHMYILDHLNKHRNEKISDHKKKDPEEATRVKMILRYSQILHMKSASSEKCIKDRLGKHHQSSSFIKSSSMHCLMSKEIQDFRIISSRI